MLIPSTFSIVGFDPVGPAWGIAVASKFPAVGAVVPWAQAGTGAVATQSFANTAFGPGGLGKMASGMPAGAALEELLSDDDGREHRQVGMIDSLGAAATFTGADCMPWAGGKIGTHFAAQGNILTGPEVVEAMAASFAQAQGDLPNRLLAVLAAGDRAGGDRRGRQSAAILVVKAGAGYGGFNDRWIDYRVDDHPAPVERLAELLELHRLYFEKSAPEDRLALQGDVVIHLKGILMRLGLYAGASTPMLDPAASKALEAFIGNENFEDRTDFKHGWIDRPVYEFLLRKHSPRSGPQA
jgi:uncharacterized Ntn-hydrolase superfamily protein